MSTPNNLRKIAIDWRTVGRRIRELRGFDTKQSELAEAIGIAQSHVSAIERGETEIGAMVLLRLARFYGKTMEWLLTGSDRSDSET